MHIILLPGLDGSGAFFTPFLQELPATVTTQIISYPRDGCATYEDVVEYVLNQIPRDTDYCILAESFSGPVALEIAALAPLRLKSLILVSSFCFSPLSPFKKSVSSKLLFLLNLPIPASFIRWLLCDSDDMNLSSRIVKTIDVLPFETLKGRVLSALNVDLRGALDDIEVPILLLSARLDRLLNKTTASTIKKYYDDAILVEIDGPHFLLQCKTDACLREIKQFLKLDQIVDTSSL